MGIRVLERLICTVLTVCVFAAGAPVGSVARAEILSASSVVAPDSQARDRIAAWLAREDIREQIAALGVDPTEVDARVAALSDAEITHLDGRISELPAGSSFAGVVGAVLLVTVAILFFTDLLGFTDVFPFVRPLPRGGAE